MSSCTILSILHDRRAVLFAVAELLVIISELDDSGRRRHDQKLFKKRLKLDVRKFAFSNRVVNDSNSLDDSPVLHNEVY